MTTTLAEDAVRGLVEPGVYANDAGDDWEVVPQTYGPTWDKDPHWDGPRSPQGYILPKLTIGWQVIHWVEANLLAEELDEYERPLPFKLTNEQKRFILWFYAIDESGHFVYREIVLQRLKGWGKDPIAAVIAAVEFVGPCRFSGWSMIDQPEIGVMKGEPVAKAHPRAWVQIAAVSKEQTKNTMTIFAALFSEECQRTHSIDIGKQIIYAYSGAKRIEAVTSSPRSLEGNRPTLVIKNETHHWLSNNEGHAMADAIERNATKAKGGAARTLSITNAYEPSDNSVAQQERESWEAGEAGLSIKTDTMYDSLEAPPSALLRPKMDETLSAEDKETLIRRYLTRVLEIVRGDSWWLDIPSLVNSILNKKNKPSRSRRFWYNQVVASEDSWLDPLAINIAISQMAKENRLIMDRDSRSVLEAGWIIGPTEPVALTLDASKSDDATGIIITRISDGYQTVGGVWQAPPKKRNQDNTWLVPREAVDKRIDEIFARFNVVAFWGDPSRTKDDEDGSRYWDGYFDKWMRKYRDRLDPQWWPVKTGHRLHAVMFDMAMPSNVAAFVAAAERYVDSMERKDDIDEFNPEFFIDGHPAFVDHLRNARRAPGQHGTSLMKEGRESAKKIDLAVCAVLGQMLRRIISNKGEEQEEGPGEVWGAW